MRSLQIHLFSYTINSVVDIMPGTWRYLLLLQLAFTFFVSAAVDIVCDANNCGDSCAAEKRSAPVGHFV